MGTMTKGTLSYLFDEVTTSVIFDASFPADAGMKMPVLYNQMQMTGGRVRSSSFGGLGVFGTKAETANADEDTFVQQFQKTMVATAYAKHLPFSRELVKDEDWGWIANAGRAMGEAFNNSVETLAAAPFNDAFTGATYTSEDDLSICNSAHLNKDGGNSQSNSDTQTASVAGVRASIIAMRKISNYEGDARLNLKPDLIISSIDEEIDFWEVIRTTTGRPDTANNVANYYNTLNMSLLSWDKLTDTSNWWLADSRRLKRDAEWHWNDPYELYGDGNLRAGTRAMGAYFRSVHGIRGWQSLYGND